MAGRALTPAGVILKWIFIPALLVVTGYFLIGARIGKVIPGLGGGGEVHATPVAQSSAAQNYAAPDIDVSSHQKLEAPDVSISARKKSRHRKPRHTADSDSHTKEPASDYALVNAKPK